MKDAFEAAWPKIKIVEHDMKLTRQLLASAIIDQVNAGIVDHAIVAGAVATLAVARNIVPR
jgi:hypothetical protein